MIETARLIGAYSASCGPARSEMKGDDVVKRHRHVYEMKRSAIIGRIKRPRITRGWQWPIIIARESYRQHQRPAAAPVLSEAAAGSRVINTQIIFGDSADIRRNSGISRNHPAILSRNACPAGIEPAESALNRPLAGASHHARPAADWRSVIARARTQACPAPTAAGNRPSPVKQSASQASQAAAA